MRVTFEQTRYKGVWSSGHAQATIEAGQALRDFVAQGGQFATNASGAFDRNTLALRLGDTIAVPDADGIVVAMRMMLTAQD